MIHGFILAAGRGSRLRPVTDTLPKPLVQVRGRALIDWRLAAMAEAGITQVVINLSWLGGAIRDHVGDGQRWGLSVRYSDEGDTALDTGGGLAHALPLLPADQPVLVTNADVWTDFPLRRLTRHAWRAGQLAHLVLVPTPDAGSADFGLAGDRVVNQPRDATFSGISLLHPDLVSGRDDTAFALAPCLREAMQRGRVTGERYDGVWSDVGTPARLAQVNAQQ